MIGRLGPVTLWHRDKHGRDGACGWSYPHPNEEQAKAIKSLGFWEGREKHYLRYAEKSHSGHFADRMAMYRCLVALVAKVCQIKAKPALIDEIVTQQFQVGGVDGPDRLFCFLPGYHTNYTEDLPEKRAEYFAGFCRGIARELLRKTRPWYRHPRWHVWHWRIHVRGLSKPLGTW